MAILIGSMDFRPIFLTETTKVSYFFKEFEMEQIIIPTAKTMAAKSEPIVKKYLQPALEYIANQLDHLTERGLSKRIIRINGNSLYAIYDNKGYVFNEKQLIQYLEEELGYEVGATYVEFVRLHTITLKW